MKKFKQFKFYSQDEQQILEAVRMFKKLGYRVVDGYFDINEAKDHGGVCVWNDREITSGWLADDDFEQVTLGGLKEMVGEGDKDNVFTLERLLGCEVIFGDTLYHVNYIYYTGAVGHLVLETDTRRAYVSDFNLLTFFTEDGDELTFDEYINMYYGGIV